MGLVTLQTPTVGLPNATEDAKVASDFTTLQTLVNGHIDTNNLSSSAGIARGQLALGASFPNLVVNTTTSMTASAGQFVAAVPPGSAITITLPTPTLGLVIGVIAGTTTGGSAVVNVTASVGSILNGTAGFVSSMTLSTVGAAGTFAADGSNWLIVAKST